MANISAKTMAEWYKNFILLDNTVASGVISTPLKLQDGGGTNLPLTVSTNGITISSSTPLYFRDTNTYVYSSAADKLMIKSPTIVVSGAVSMKGTLTPILVSTASHVTASGIRSKYLKNSGTASITTVSATTMKGTLLHASTISGTTIKGNIDFSSLTKSVKLGTGNYFYLQGVTTLFYGNDTGIHIKHNLLAGADTLRISATAIVPGTSGAIDFGKSSYALNSVRANTGTFTTTNAGTIAITGGTATGMTYAHAKQLTASTIKPTSQLTLNSVSMYFDTSKGYSLQHDGSTGVRIKGMVFPSGTTGTYDLGKTTSRWGTVYATNASITDNLDIDGEVAVGKDVSATNLRATASGVVKYLSIIGIPSSSTSVSIGGVYEVASVLMIRKT